MAMVGVLIGIVIAIVVGVALLPVVAAQVAGLTTTEGATGYVPASTYALAGLLTVIFIAVVIIGAVKFVSMRR